MDELIKLVLNELMGRIIKWFIIVIILVAIISFLIGYLCFK